MATRIVSGKHEMVFNSLTAFRRRRIVRAGMGLLVLAVAVILQYKLANVPRPVNLESTGRFSPATIKLGQEELVIEGPVSNSLEGMLFSHDGARNEIVDASFERARLDEGTIELFRSLGLTPPSTPVRLDYRVQEPSKPATADESCRTRVELRTFSRMPSEIHLFQLGDAGQDHDRHLEIETVGGQLTSHLFTQSPPNNSDLAPGCQKLLRVGNWNQSLTTVEVAAIADEGSRLQLSFKSLRSGSSLWGGPEGFFEPFDLGAQQLNPTDLPPLQARGVSIRPLGNNKAVALMNAESARDGTLLTVSGLKIGSNQIRISVAGKGWVKTNGEDETVNVLRRIEENKVLSGILAAGNAALLALVGRLVFKSAGTSERRRHPCN